jgi:hypothetical protein
VNEVAKEDILEIQLKDGKLKVKVI